MRILITGGAGYIGTGLVSELAESPDVEQIIIYDNLSRQSRAFFLGEGRLSDKILFIEGDLLDSRQLKHALSGVNVVYHAAAVVTTPFADQNAHLFEQINHWGTAELVYAIEAQHVEHLIYLSSASVYGASSEEMHEESPTIPKTFYGISKLRGEDHVKRYMLSGGRATIIRSGNVYGYNRSLRFDSVINRFMFEAHFKGRISIDGDGHQKRSFINIKSLCRVLSSFDSVFPKTGIYNLVENTWSINEVALVLKAVYPNLETLYINQNIRLRELLMKRNEYIFAKIKSTSDLKSSLQEFEQHFTY